MKLLTYISFIITILSPLVYAQNNTLENNTLVKADSKFITLIGQQINVGDIAPDFKVVDESFSKISLDQFLGKNILISVVPSLDTGICSIQTKKFNDQISSSPKNTVFITISTDLPFAQKRLCDSEKINDMTVLSDSVWRDFGTKYGLLIKDMGLLTRAIFIINAKQEVVYKELVSDIASHPNYNKALEALILLNNQHLEKQPKEFIKNQIDKK
jgi:thiol peroxidase